jgi:hypothetical protein
LPFTLKQTNEAREQYQALVNDPSKAAQLKAVRKALAYLQANPRHPGLNTHEYSSLEGVNGEKVWEAYAQNQTPGAYRIFWHYGPGREYITIVAITPHP